MRRRINATRWPEKETVTEPNFSQRGVSPNWGQGVQLATIQKLARYWATDYDWRKVEARLKALPQFITNLLGMEGQLLRCQKCINPGCRQCLPRRNLLYSAKLGRAGVSQTHLLQQGFLKEDTLQPGNSRSSIPKRFVRASDHCATDHLSRFGPPFTFSVPDLFLSHALCTHVSEQVIEINRCVPAVYTST